MRGQEERIARSPSVHFGKPVIKGTRVTVSALVGAVASGDPLEQVAEDYGVTVDDVRSALLFALDRVEEIVNALKIDPVPIVAKRFGMKQARKVLTLFRGQDSKLLRLLAVMRSEGIEEARKRFGNDALKGVLQVAADLCDETPLEPTARQGFSR